MQNDQLSILFVEDSAFMRLGLRNHLEKHEFVVHEAANVADALALFDQCQPDIAILDISLPKHLGEQPEMEGTEGLQIAALMKSKRPDVGVILLSSHLSYYQQVHELAIKYQGIAYLFKGENPRDELIHAIEQVRNGGVWIAPAIVSYQKDNVYVPLTKSDREMMKDIIARFATLSSREKEIVQLSASSLKNEEIAQKLSLTLNMVSSFLTGIYAKVGLGEPMQPAEKHSWLTKAFLTNQRLNTWVEN